MSQTLSNRRNRRVVAIQPVPVGRLLAVYGLLCAGLVFSRS